MAEDLRVNRRIVIPGEELRLKFTTSSGPGGQHANRSSTRAEVTWNVASTTALGPRQRERVMSRLRHRIDSQGNLRLAADAHRSQLRNRQEVLARLARLVDDALTPDKARVATGPTRSSVERRLQQKRRRSDLKRSRRIPTDD